MIPYTKLLLQNEGNNIFSEGVNYFDTQIETSIWGEPRLGIKNIIDNLEVGYKNNCIDIGSGDGRYTELLLSVFEGVTCMDIDKSALSKLKHRYDRSQVTTICHNIAEPYPCTIGPYTCALATGLMHYFDPRKVFEIGRQVYDWIEPNGVFIFDFSSEVKRQFKDGEATKTSRGYEYSIQETLQTIDQLSSFFDISFKVEFVKDKPMLLLNRECLWSSIDLQVIARKSTLSGDVEDV